MRRHTHDDHAMSACVPTADVSLHRGERQLRAIFELMHRSKKWGSLLDHLVGAQQ